MVRLGQAKLFTFFFGQRWVLLILLVIGNQSLAQGDDQAVDGLIKADLGRCELVNGQVLEPCTLAYRLLGNPAHRARGDEPGRTLLIPTWYTGTTANMLDFGYIGAGKMFDPGDYFIVAVEAFSNGLSSSPSHLPPEQRHLFPEVAIADMVIAQQRLLTEVLEMNRIHAVAGVSLGGMQALEWAARFPSMMDKVVSVEGSPWANGWDMLTWDTQLKVMQGFDGSESSREFTSAVLARLDGLGLWTRDHFASMVTVDGYGTFLDSFDPKLSAENIADRSSQILAALQHDIGKVAVVEGQPNRPAAIAGIRAEMLLVVFEHDQYVHPQPSKALAEQSGAQLLVSDTACGHMGPTTECEQAWVAQAVRAFLAATEQP